MTPRVDVSPRLFSWAIERSGRDRGDLLRQFGRLESWLDQSAKPTLKQLEAFARATYTPVGFLLLNEPPEDRLPIPDYRTMANAPLTRPSADLLETIYICQQRQDWYRDYALSNGFERLSFVGSVDQTARPEDVAREIRETLKFDVEARSSMATWDEALTQFFQNADEAGVLIMRNGIVLNNTRRRLNPKEFRGFALCDEVAPLVFVNGADTKSAQMFTLAHELAHIWLGETALSSADPGGIETQIIERWCNAVAADLLVPLAVFHTELREERVDDALSRLARRFKVSTLVILRRMLDANYLSRQEYDQAYTAELDRLLSLGGGTGGDFYRSQMSRLGRRFARALIVSTLEGNILYRDAMKMLGIRKVATFHELGRSLGVPV